MITSRVEMRAWLWRHASRGLQGGFDAVGTGNAMYPTPLPPPVHQDSFGMGSDAGTLRGTQET